ncbi:MAG: hypothetical protein ACRDRO_02605 [Pseudonocardiaceae bacterium]
MFIGALKHGWQPTEVNTARAPPTRVIDELLSTDVHAIEPYANRGVSTGDLVYSGVAYLVSVWWPVSPGVVTGRVAGPGSAGFGDQAGGVVLVVAEHLGDDRRRCLQDELSDRCGPASETGDPVLA